MKNIHLLLSSKPSRLHEFGGVWFGHKEPTECFRNYNIHITSDEEIKEGDWFYNTFNDNQPKLQKRKGGWRTCFNQHKIILTTDQDLIKDGVQAIDDEFLEWFVKNPSCEFVKVKPYCEKLTCQNKDCNVCCQELKYKIIIPQEEPKKETLSYTEAAKKDERIFNSTMMKQETIEEATENLTTDQIAWRWLDIEENYNSIEDTISFVKGVEIGANWQAERMYSEEEVKTIWRAGQEYWKTSGESITFEELIKQFKKK
jgi:hypothetical protein